MSTTPVPRPENLRELRLVALGARDAYESLIEAVDAMSQLDPDVAAMIRGAVQIPLTMTADEHMVAMARQRGITT